MRRWRIVLAGAAVAVGTVITSGPVHAVNTNSVCRVVTNEARRLLQDSGVQDNQAFNRDRNEICGSLPK
jgi:hypothetical protein